MSVSSLFRVFMLIALAYLGAGSNAYAQSSDKKKITAFYPPKIDYAKSCIKSEAEPALIHTSDNRLSNSQKLRVAVELLDGGDGVFPDPARGVRLLQQLINSKGQVALRAKMKMAWLYMHGKFLPENRDKAMQLALSAAPGYPYKAAHFLARIYSKNGEYVKAEEYYKRAALAGNSIAYLDMAFLYRGNFIKGQTQERINQLVSLAESKTLEEIAKGNCEVLYYIGRTFMLDDTSSENYAVAVKWLEASAASGNSSAMRSLGKKYLYGDKVEQDVNKGLTYYHQAAKLHDAESLFSLGQYWLLKKTSTTENRKKGVLFLVKAAQQGHQKSIIKLVEYYKGDFGDKPQYKKAVDLMERAVNLSGIQAKIPYMLAEMYAEGKGTKVNYKRAFQLYDRAAKLNYRDALVKLGDAYKYGLGVKRSPIKSYRFYRQAGSLGDRDAMFALVKNYQCGVGKAPKPRYENFWSKRAIYAGAGKLLRPEVRRLMLSKDKEDNVAGYILIKRRVADGDREAMVTLSHFYRNGIGVEKSDKHADEWLKKAIAEGDEQEKGYKATGKAYMDADLFGIHPQEAEKYFMKAIQLGSEDAGYELGKIYQEGQKDFPINLDRAAIAYRNAAERGNDSAMRKLASILLDKNKDDAEGLRLLQQSAVLHNMDAMIDLVKYYLDQVTQENKQAVAKVYYWYNKALANYPCDARIRDRLTILRQKITSKTSAGVSINIEDIKKRANSGSLPDMRALAKRYVFGYDNVPPNPREAFAWYIKAAKAGDAESMLEIGNAFSTGMGVKQSKQKAHEWWQRAAKSGSEKAAQMLKVDSSIVENAPAKKAGH